jgi:hypothetical protein
MRFFEFNQTLEEGGKSNPIRYNSEVGMLFAFVGNGQFDPANPEQSISREILSNPDQVYKDIKNLLGKNYDERLFSSWVKIGESYKSKIVDKLGSLPSKFGWAGGSNIAGGVTDITFEGSKIAGISIKAEGGITLANLSPSSLGIEVERGIDVFSKAAKEEYDQMKQSVVTDVLAQAKENPGLTISPIDPKYSITYNSETNTFKCTGKQTVDWPQEKILANLEKNAKWQRVFGDWFQSNWQSKKSYATPLYQKVAKAFETTIENHLQDNAKLTSMLRFGDVPYFYATPSNLYYVPTVESVALLQIKGIKYAEPDGTSQRFIANIGRPDSDQNAGLDIYIRYANGMFESNPTVRVQSLKNPQFISWELL